MKVQILDHGYLIKKSQAQLAGQFQRFKRENRNRPNDAKRVAMLEYFYTQMRGMNQKGRNR